MESSVLDAGNDAAHGFLKVFDGAKHFAQLVVTVYGDSCAEITAGNALQEADSFFDWRQDRPDIDPDENSAKNDGKGY